jgi:hypothetical protein
MATRTPAPASSCQVPALFCFLRPPPTERRAADCSVWNCVRCACCRTTATLLRLTSRLLLRKGTISKRQLANPATAADPEHGDPHCTRTQIKSNLRTIDCDSCLTPPARCRTSISSILSFLADDLILQKKAKSCPVNAHPHILSKNPLPSFSARTATISKPGPKMRHSAHSITAHAQLETSLRTGPDLDLPFCMPPLKYGAHELKEWR